MKKINVWFLIAYLLLSIYTFNAFLDVVADNNYLKNQSRPDSRSASKVFKKHAESREDFVDRLLSSLDQAIDDCSLSNAENQRQCDLSKRLIKKKLDEFDELYNLQSTYAAIKDEVLYRKPYRTSVRTLLFYFFLQSMAGIYLCVPVRTYSLKNN